MEPVYFNGPLVAVLCWTFHTDRLRASCQTSERDLPDERQPTADRAAGLRDHPEIRRGRIQIRTPEVRSVQGVGCVHPRLQSQPVLDQEAPLHARIQEQRLVRTQAV